MLSLPLAGEPLLHEAPCGIYTRAARAPALVLTVTLAGGLRSRCACIEARAAKFLAERALHVVLASPIQDCNCPLCSPHRVSSPKRPRKYTKKNNIYLRIGGIMWCVAICD